MKSFKQKRILYSWTQNSPLWARKFSPNYLHSNQVDTWNIFWDDEICDEKLPRENPEKQVKSRKILISTSSYQRYTKFTSLYMLWWMINAIEWVKISLRITKYVKIQDGRQLGLKKSFSLWNQLICQPQYCLNRAKTKGFKVLCVFIAN